MPPVVLAPFVPWRQFDANGDPLAGGLLFSYIAGTSTPLTTYADPAGTTPHTNPVVLQDDGSAMVYLQAGAYYKLIQYDKDSVLQWSCDQIPGSGGSPAGSLQAATVTLNAVAGPGALVAPAAWQPGWRQLGVTARVTIAFSTTSGLTQLAMGDAVQFDRWGLCGVTLGSTTDAADFLTGDSPWTTQATDVLVTPIGGGFGATGQVTLTLYYTTLS